MNCVPAFVALTPVTKRLESEVLRLATTPRTTISITGPMGSGKQAWARRLHAESARGAEPFVVLEPGMPLDQHMVAAAGGGCLYVREAGHLGDGDQGRLMDLLGGASGGGDVDGPRVIAASREPLEAAVQAGRLGEGLEYRLNVLALEVPGLSERLGELGALAKVVLERVAGELGVFAPGMEVSAETALAGRDWPGNLHQLAWVLRGVLLGRLGVDNLGSISEDEMNLNVKKGSEGQQLPTKSLSLDAVEEDAVRRALEACGGNRSLAARQLGIHRTTLYHKLRRFGL